jgi:hypothetical protein
MKVPPRQDIVGLVAAERQCEPVHRAFMPFDDSEGRGIAGRRASQQRDINSASGGTALRAPHHRC